MELKPCWYGGFDIPILSFYRNNKIEIKAELEFLKAKQATA